MPHLLIKVSTRDACVTQNQIQTYNIVPMWRVSQSGERGETLNQEQRRIFEQVAELFEIDRAERAVGSATATLV